jgi:hypothetical protein
MSTRKLLPIFCGVVLLGALAASTAHAGLEGNRRTYFTFSQPIQLPGVSLAAGTYLFEVPDPMQAWDVVRISSRDQKHVYLTAFTIRVERPADRKLESKIVFGETSASNPPRIQAWYPEGEHVGRQFIY